MLPYNTESTRQKLAELNQKCVLDGIFICNLKNTLQLLEYYSISILGREMTNYRYMKTVLERRILMEGWL